MERVVKFFKRLVVAVVILFVITVFGLFAFNFYRHYTAGEPDARPPVIYERSDRPSRA
ncbi:putative negative regulator of RcsB-dependent stress response [Nitrobacteraceae bacterium AZCC 1564]